MARRTTRKKKTMSEMMGSPAEASKTDAPKTNPTKATAKKPAAKPQPVKSKTITLKEKRKILIIAHNHPTFFPGGAEILAHDLFTELKQRDQVDAFFLGGVSPQDRKVHTGTPFQAVNGAADEMIFWGADFDYFLQSQNVKSFLTNDFKQFLLDQRPDIIHFHHTMRIGLEAIQIARQTLPNAKIVYTLHEFILMCYRDGQMVRTHDNALCEQASPARCNQCFPDISPAGFKMRETFIKAHLQHVDQFISPSHFLADRFVNWGIPAEKITVQENGRKLEKPTAPRKIAAKGKRNHFGYFGQINPYKGAMLALEAATHLIQQGVEDFHFEFFGNIELQEDEFKQSFFELLEQHPQQISFHGKYDQADLPELMAGIDWVVMPSTWWENAPLVIQEAFMHKRPVISSNIGGMAEKVDDGTTGLHFRARNARSLADVMQQAITTDGLWKTLSDNIKQPLSIEGCADDHLALYESLISSTQPAAKGNAA